MTTESSHASQTHRDGKFLTTMWSAVHRVREGNESDAAEAFDQLCRWYWYPIYAYVRRQGQSEHDAQDLTQGFFSRLLEKEQLKSVDASKGKFRSFLLTSLKWYLTNEWAKASAEKRGGRAHTFSLNEEEAEDQPPFSPMNSVQTRSSRTFRQKQIPSSTPQAAQNDFKTRFAISAGGFSLIPVS